MYVREFKTFFDKHYQVFQHTKQEQ